MFWKRKKKEPVRGGVKCEHPGVGKWEITERFVSHSTTLVILKQQRQCPDCGWTELKTTQS